MWLAKYDVVSLNGFEPTITVRVQFYNDVDESGVFETFKINPENLDSQEFQDLIQERIAILNAKQAVLDSHSFDVKALQGTPAGVQTPSTVVL